MYEIWLALNILFELMLMYLPTVVGIAVVWLALMAIAFKRGKPAWAKSLKPAIVVGVIVTVLGLLTIPGLTQSSLSEMGYWVDWANLFAVAAGFGAIAALLAIPLAATMRRA